jgi:hypothetical protein
MQNIAQQIFYGLLVELISVILFFWFKDKPKAAISILALGTLIAAFVAFYRLPPIIFYPTSFPTSIPVGSLISDIDFTISGDGNCNDYDQSKLGYDTSNKLYYIIPEKNGLISVCHENDNLQPQGILQATAFPDGDLDYFGYAVLFGWDGYNTTTTDDCGFGIMKNKSITHAIFIQKIGGKPKLTSIELKNYELDTSPHSVRMVLYPSGKAVGYVDDNYIAEHTFVNCKTGPIGLIAYGPGQARINFTSLKLFGLP